MSYPLIGPKPDEAPRHPTPWRVRKGGAQWDIVDANGSLLFEAQHSKRALAELVVTTINRKYGKGRARDVQPNALRYREPVASAENEYQPYDDRA